MPLVCPGQVGVNGSVTAEGRRIQQQKQEQRREPEAVGAESCLGVGVTVKVMGSSGRVKVSNGT